MHKLELVLKSKTFRIAASGAILIYLSQFLNAGLLYSFIWRIKPSFLILASCIVPISILVRAYSFFLIVNKDERRMSLRDTYAISLIGGALNLFLPASSGDLAKVYFGYRSHRLMEELLSASLYDKLTSVVAVFALGASTSYFLGLRTLSLSLLALTILLLLPLFLPKALPWKSLNRLLRLALKRELDAEKLTSSSKLQNVLKLRLLAISTLGWLITYSGFFAISRMFDVKISLQYVLAIAPIITVARLFPLTLGGLGSTEAAVAYLFGAVGIGPTAAIAVSLAFQAIFVVLPGIAGFFLIFQRSGQPNASPPDQLLAHLKLGDGEVLEDESRSPFVVRLLVRRLHEAVGKEVSAAKARSLLDVGCGQGWHLKYLRKQNPGIHFHGVDIRENAIKIARELNPELHIACGDAYDLPFEDSSFDMLIAVEVLEHLDDPIRAVREVGRVARKRCVFAVPHEPFFRLSNLASGKYIGRLGSFPGHRQHWTKSRFSEMLESLFPEVRITKSFPWLIASCSKSEPL